MTISRVAVLGLGRVGVLAAELLVEAGFDVVGVDQRQPENTDFAFQEIDLSQDANLAELVGSVDAVLSCLPYQLNVAIATHAHTKGVHYFDLTEDVPTTAKILELSKTATALMAPQCGLAPGLVGIVAADLIESLDECRSVKMRVGALPQNPDGLLGYSFTWSPTGVVNEYLNDCEVIEDGERKFVSSMEWHEPVYLSGTRLEAFTTSGGLGTMCDTYHGRVHNLDYKSLRYPGHVDLMNFFFHELLMRDDRSLAEQILTKAKPPVSDDVVFLHVSAEGHKNERLQRLEFARRYMPRVLAGKERTAIAWTTAGSVVSVIEMVRDGLLPDVGFLKQEDIPFHAYCATQTGAAFVE